MCVYVSYLSQQLLSAEDLPDLGALGAVEVLGEEDVELDLQVALLARFLANGHALALHDLLVEG